MRVQSRGDKIRSQKNFDSDYLQNVINDISEDLLDELVRQTPKDTGFARGSWSTKTGRLRTTIKNTADYSSYLDEGSSSQSRRGMTGPAIDKIKRNADSGKYRNKRK